MGQFQHGSGGRAVIVTVAQIKAQLNLDDAIDDALVELKAQAAQNHVERLLGFRIEEEFVTVPPALQEAVLQLAAHWYENREASGDASGRCVSAVSAGSTTITVDETGAREPVRVGAYLSYDDWPFVVVGRSGGGNAAVLSVKMLRTPIPAGKPIDLLATGLFLAKTDTMGAPGYGVDRIATIDLDFIEWLHR